MGKRKKILLAYLVIIAVIFIWGAVPSVKRLLIGNGISASLYATLAHLCGAPAHSGDRIA